MSNDQSPPARKVIPYKKGGRRPSPFSEMAFQYSGTALDVAIQQREQDKEISPSETPANEESSAGSAAIDVQDSEVPRVQSVNFTTAAAHPAPPDIEEQESFSPQLDYQRGQTAKQTSPKSFRPLSGEKNKRLALASTNLELQSFIDRWKPFLTDTQLGICTFIYANSTAINQEYCFTSTAKLMAAVSKTERQVKTVLNQLLDWELVFRGETVINTPRDKRGTYYKLNPDKS